jgi:hypothetical protein
VTVEGTGAIDATGFGYPQNTTYPGATVSGDATGGSHMGWGGTLSPPIGSTYGSVTRPAEAGAGTGNIGPLSYAAAGGGVLRISSATLTLTDTTSVVRANGATSSLRSGAGGSVWITTGTLAGSGSIEAKGGVPVEWGVGGGGAIAIEYGASAGNVLANVHAEAGTPSAQSKFGGAGTIFLKGPGSIFGDLIVDNRATSGQPTEMPSFGGGTAQPGSQVTASGALLVTGKASAIPAYFVGHWVEIRSAANVLKGTWRIGSIDGTSVVLVDSSTTDRADVAAGDSWQGVYRFDHPATVSGGATLRNLTTSGLDPVRVVTPGGLRR